MPKDNNIISKVVSFYMKVKVLPWRILFRKLTRKTKQLFSISRREFGKYPNLLASELSLEDLQFVKLNIFLPELKVLLAHRDNIISKADDIVNHSIVIFNKQYSVNLQTTDIKAFVSSNIKVSLQPDCYQILQNLNEAYRQIDWSRDFESDYSWSSNLLASKLKYEKSGIDVKFPWELGRLQYLNVLVYASALTNYENDKYGRELRNQIIDFIGSNPVGYGIQWKSPMDAAIRLINLLFIAASIKYYSIRIDEEAALILESSIFEHLEFIISNPEWNDGLRGNHYLFCITAILITSIILPETVDSLNLQNHAFILFERELFYQFHPDGTSFEASVPYHFFAAEAVMLISNIIRDSKQSALRLDEPSEERIKAIAMACKSLTMTDGSVPQIGDNDSGFLLKLHPEDIFSDSELNYNHVLRLIDANVTRLQNFSANNFGLYVFNKDKYSLYFRCGQVGQYGKGGHAHNDQLSFVLYIHNKPFFVDAGTYCYTRDHSLRNQYRSTEYHNTIVCLNQEQNIYFENSKDDLFWLFDKTNAEVEYKDNERIIGKHYGYRSAGKVVVCKREINMSDSSEIIFTDTCPIEEKYISLHLHPNVKVSIVSDNIVKMKSDDVEIFLIVENGLITTGTYYYSPGYFQQEESCRLKIIPNGDEIVWQIHLNQI